MSRGGFFIALLLFDGRLNHVHWQERRVGGSHAFGHDLYDLGCSLPDCLLDELLERIGRRMTAIAGAVDRYPNQAVADLEQFHFPTLLLDLRADLLDRPIHPVA